MAKEHVIGPYSAYAIAVKHGFVGTEAEWAALQKNAPEYARAAAQSAESAAGSAANATSSQKAAAASANAAEAAKTAANQSAQAASTSAASASSAQTAAKASADTALAAEQAAEEAASRAQEVADSIPEDYTALAEAVRLKAPAIICEKSGDIVTVTDAAAEQVVSLVSHIVPVQEGTGDPSPENVRPISGWDSVEITGNGSRNVLTGEVLECGLGNQENGVYIMPGSQLRSLYAKVKPGGYYTVSRATTEANVRFSLGVSKEKYSGSQMECVALTTIGANTNDSQFVVLIPDGYPHLYVYVDNTSAEIDITQYWACEGKTPLFAYEPYQGQTLTIDLPETVYGGTPDWTTGLLTVTRSILSAAENSRVAKVEGSEHVFRWGHNLTFAAGNAICSHLKYGSAYKDKEYSFYVNDTYIYMTILDCSTEEEALAWLIDNSVVFCGMLAEPYTIQLTPQQLTLLKGTNNVWSSTGQTDLEYIADTKLYINDRIAAIAAAALSN